MKKTLLFAMIAVLLFSAAACGQPDTIKELALKQGFTDGDLQDKINPDTSGDSLASAEGSDFSESGSSQNNGQGSDSSAENDAGTTDSSGLSSASSGASSSSPNGRSSQASSASASSSLVSATAKTVKVTIIEGESMVQIFKKLESKGVCSFDSLMTAAQSYDYSYYPLIASVPGNENRCFLLEGYLFPDTYEFYIGEKPQDAIGRFLKNAQSRITSADQARAAELGLSTDQILTVASIIQKEGSKASEVANVAAVIYNRMKNGQKLQMDATVNYIEYYVKNYIDGDTSRYNNYYNTYKCAALPAGPICNPGRSTINAALHPADVPYLFFCHDADGNYYYAATYAEHLANMQKAGIT